MAGWTKKTGGGFPGGPSAEAPTEEAAGATAEAPAAETGEDEPASEAETAPEADAAEAAADGGEKAEVALPSGWGEEPRRAPKRWSDGARSDSPDKRVVLEPMDSGVGDGKSALFLFGLKIHSPLDQEFLARIREHIDDDVEALRKAGYTVAIDEQATHRDFLDAAYGQGEGVAGLRPAALFWNAHGLADGSIQTCDGGVVRPEDVEAEKVSEDLKLVVFASCYAGNRSRTWREALGGRPLVVGWGRPVTVDRAIEFLTPDEETETDLDDLIRRYLLTDVPVPGLESLQYSPMTDVSATGYAGDLPGRMTSVVEMLGGRFETAERWIWVDVPLTGGRWHRAKVFAVDSTAAFIEGEPLLAVESDIGEITSVVDPVMLLAGVFGPDYARIALVESETDMPRMVAQGFLPLARVRNQDLAALIFHVCSAADAVERRVFGTDAV